ncbi:MAG: bacterial transcriptional activator domain-containing protein, partial [Gammaproteobacteria bacterium]|nr:bacterial transcriptional activator domain-containing protein [Gammaproteobacteria bacterium]
HSPYPESLCRSQLAYLYSESDRLEDAIKEVDKAEPTCRAFNTYSGLAVILFIRSWVALKLNNRNLAICLLKEAFDVMYEKDIKSYTVWPYKMISGLCAVALENNIRPEFVKQVIAIHKYKPPNNQSVSEHWPYPIKIYTLNRFGVVKNNQALRLSDKNQQFMKALIAFGGRDVHEQTLSDALWPDAEGDAAHQNFATTLHRVRKAVGNKVIQLRQNRVSLNPDYCWIDIWALKRNLGEIEESLLNSKHSLQELTERAVSLYQGPFLGVDENEHWILSAREKLSNQFLKMLNLTAESFCQTKEYQQALNGYQKGLEIDDLSEKIYQGLIYCHTCLGNRTEGLAIYEQCCERLNTTFGIEPSSETDKLYQLLKDS